MKSPNKRRKKRPLLRRPLMPHPQRLNDSLLSNLLLLKSSQLKMTLQSSIRRTTSIPITFWLNLLSMPMRIWQLRKAKMMMIKPSIKLLRTVTSQEPQVLQPPNLPRRSSSNISILKV